MQIEPKLVKRTMKTMRETFDALKINYAVCGSVAGWAHGYERSTLDIDIVAQMRPEHVEPFTRILQEANFYVDDLMIRDAIRARRSFNMLDENTYVKVAVFVPTNSAWNENVFARSITGFLGDDTESFFQVEATEDLVLAKLIWFRKGNEVSDQKWKDVLAVLKLQSFDIDLEYLQYWAPQLGVADLWDRALDGAGFNETQTQSD